MYSGPAIGLYNSPNPFSQTPAGTLKRADNVRFTAPGVLEPRRGFNYLGATFGSSASRMDSMAFYKAAEDAAYGILAAYDLTTVTLYSGSTFTDFSGTFVPVGSNRMRFEGAARSAFFNTTDGLWVWDGVGVGGQPVLAGNALPLTASAQCDSASGWQTADTAVAYRWTICSKDAFQRVIEGPPSGRTTLRNSLTAIAGEMSRSGTTVSVTYNLQENPYVLHVGDVVTLAPGEANFPAGAKTITAVNNAISAFFYTEAGSAVSSTVAATFSIATSGSLTLPLTTGSQANVTTNNFIRLYRSEMTATATDTPSDELFQCYESGYLTSADISAGYLLVLDTAPESVLDVPLYTNENTGAGALQANHQPPRTLDIVYWANRMWGANVSYKDSLTFSLIGVGSPDGIQVGDTFEIDFDTHQDIYTAAVAAAGTDFQVFTDGDPGWNIERTARSLVQQINLNPTNDAFAAYYVSSEGGIPGSILIQSVSFGDPFTLASSRATCWTPQLPTYVAPAFPAPASTTDTHPAGLVWSRLGQPEAFPITNRQLVNSDNDAILRIFPLHYRLLIFKTDGIYTCTNVEPFTLTRLSAYVLLSPDSVCVLEDRVYALTTQGIITISDAGVVQTSNCIDDTFNALDTPTQIDATAARSFGLSYNSERQSLLWVPEKEDDGTFSADNAQAFVYSTLSAGFTRYGFGARCGAINPDTNSMYLAPTDENAVWVENKNLTTNDYFDLIHQLGTMSSVVGDVVTLTALAYDVEVGDAIGHIVAGMLQLYVVTAVDGLALTTNGPTGWTSGTVFLLPAIECQVEFNKLADGAPATLKLISQVALLFRENGIHDTLATLSSEAQPLTVEVGLLSVGWGEFPWGAQPYGTPTEQIRRVEPIPPTVAQCAQLSLGFRTRQALAKFEFLGVDVLSKKDATVAGR